MQPVRLRQIVEAARDKRVLCVGDVMLDRFVYGVVERISPEAPVPVLRQTRAASMPGGAANVARNLASLGLDAVIVGAIGEDEAGRELAGLLDQSPGISAHLVVLKGRPTTLKTRMVAGGQQLLRLDAEEVGPPDADSERALIAQITALIPAVSAILISDYAKGLLSAALIDAVLEGAHLHNLPVIADPKGKDFNRYGAVDILKPNAGELASAVGLPTATTEDVERALEAAQAQLPAKAIVVTRAAQGMSYIAQGGPPGHVSGKARDVFDVSGAGDTSLAALAIAIVAGASLDEAVQLAILASGIAVGKSGTATVSASELLDTAALEQWSQKAGTLSVDAMVGQIERWREGGLRIGFTNGVFDILHPGHIRVLEESRSRCDRLIVGLNSDASVKRLKGPERPVNDAVSRAQVLCGLASVDGVVVFEEDTPLELITALKPDVLIKGGDYSRETIVGADLVEARGGEVVIVATVPGHSTTSTIARSKGGS
ncbi:MAG: D-glycero-beta-D-manno-heptose 1-phosphate adenylyltransferase [Hyphomonas sp.]|uniref:D-glycero-beta-D-manno-heptose 1-phosphate adenylyltransferase n=1 Tax=Hyphomonas sp. TaxID=87 RepID=UPI00185AC0D3|nr:D-glycero-beta-D-manno-heptose 1-phosphate adenylyltransferase [Hyphomonas sp.]MBA3069693.1 D-glycero-beta-D-manno-heptose 1-phosphate adenylyltransferase [Hyphomonas sp.]MBU4062534.1 D-glycero-beta-D-manno-heptose 1-phosphate adenylyltransferase [Alphaproteobacteria bacterium]MBU4163885.1 D-glycero-beta-D-manno-heptose 1-phosphate adenylyltransferase [Alphaproteobacteria bacterium]